VEDRGFGRSRIGSFGVKETTNADLTRRGFEAWNERRFDRVLEFFHEDAVWDMTPFGAPDMSVFRGHDGLRRFFAEWLHAFPDSTIEIEDVEQQGDWTLSAVLQLVSGGASGTPVPFRYGGIGHWRDGRLDLVENHPDLDRARIAFERYASAER
jgi:ketosteroid isomerase-like protein